MDRITIVFWALLCSTIAIAQTTVRGRVIDSNTHEPLAFANIVFNNDNKLQIITDIDGQFSYSSKSLLSTIKCSYSGYNSYAGSIADQAYIAIEMTPSVNELKEVFVVSGENPANRIIQKVIANRNYNNPENLSSFQYTCYNKMVFDFLFHKNKRDSVAISRTLINSHLLLTESVTERKFLKPHWSEEVVLATRFSGLKNPTFASLATDWQPFSFYQDHIKLFDIRYLNPIADGALKKYRYRLEEELYKERDTIFIISYKPLPGKNFDGLEGLLYVNSNKYAIQNVIAGPFEKGKVNLKIQQQYQFVNNAYWFPEQLNYTLTIAGYPSKDIGIYSEGKSYIRDVAIDVPLTKKDFSELSVRIDNPANEKDAAFWESSRNFPLTSTEKNTYRTIDSIGQSMHFDRYLIAFQKIIIGRFPLPYIDIDLKKTLLYNRYEGLRLGTGFISNADLLRNVEMSGFFGYGLKDEQWKYGTGVNYWINRERNLSVGAIYQDNLNEVGDYGLKPYGNNLYNFRKFIGYRYDRIEQVSFNVGFRNVRFAEWKICLDQAKISPQYDYRFQNQDLSFTNYRKTVLSLYLRYAYGEELIGSFGNTFSGTNKYPIVDFLISKGFKNILGGEISYTKLEVATEHSFYTRNIGLTKYRFEAGWTNQSLPAGLLFTGEGSYDADVPFLIKNSFQTMQPYEFLSDRYANLFLSHHFGTLLFKTRLLQPDISIHNNIGWGTLSKPEYHQFIAFDTKEEVYFECGLQLDNLLKLNYANLGYLGIGTAAFYRYGPYTFTDFEDNIALKITLNFTIK